MILELLLVKMQLLQKKKERKTKQKKEHHSYRQNIINNATVKICCRMSNPFLMLRSAFPSPSGVKKNKAHHQARQDKFKQSKPGKSSS